MSYASNQAESAPFIDVTMFLRLSDRMGHITDTSSGSEEQFINLSRVQNDRNGKTRLFLFEIV